MEPGRQRRVSPEKAIAEIKKLGGTVNRDLQDRRRPAIGVGFLMRRNIQDGDLAYLQALTQLQQLDLRESSITDAGLEHLRGLTRLEWVALQETHVTDAGLKHLGGLT